MARQKDESETKEKEDMPFLYSKEIVIKVAQEKFGLSRTETVAAFFNAPESMTIEEAESIVKNFKERKVR